MTGSELKNLIRGTGLSQSEAASRIGVSRQTLASYLNYGEIPEDILQNVKKGIPELKINNYVSDSQHESTENYVEQPETIYHTNTSVLTPAYITELRIFNKLSQEEFAKIINMTSREMIGKIERGERQISRRADLEIKAAIASGKLKTMEDTFKSKSISVPVYDTDFSAGFLEMIQDSPNKILANLNIPEADGCDFFIRAKGDSMADKIFDRDWLGLKEVRDQSIIIYGNIYAIVTSELQIIKYIKKCDKPDSFCLSSENQHYQDFDIPKDKILNLYIVKTILPFSQVKTLI